jgi:riboflavin kinase/FMN adenylyltransferase
MTESAKRVTDLAAAGNGPPTYLAIGVFDGVHRGHQKLLRAVVEAAKEDDARPAALTFYPHPREVILGQQEPFYLCTLDDRLALMAEMGLELVITLPFDEATRLTPAAEFVDSLCRDLNLGQLWGGSFGLGHNREGDLPFLQRMGRERGFTVQPFESIVRWEGEPVSSSRIRHGLREGDMELVSACLGRHYCVSGVVVPGDGRGRQLGIPTANLDFWPKLLLPATGVYAAYAIVDGQRIPAAANIGYRPTVDGHTLNVEAHLLNFDGDLYGREIHLDIVARVRDERKFPNLEALVAQIQKDIVEVSKLLTP